MRGSSLFCCREKYLLKQPAHNSDVGKVSSDVTENVLRCHSCLVSPLTRPHPLPLLVHRPSKSKQTKDRLQTSVCVTRRKEMQKAEDPQKHAFKQNYFQLSHRATVSQYSLQVTTTWPSQQTMSAGSGDKDQFRACNCDLRSILSLNKPSCLYFTINWRVWKRKEKKEGSLGKGKGKLKWKNCTRKYLVVYCSLIVVICILFFWLQRW